jgi:hypothetical protein
LTYKDSQQNTKIVYVPKSQLARMQRMIANYKKVRAIIEEIVETNIKVFKEETRR